jgi:putative two-component system response regulator
MKILAVDDDDIALEVLAEALRRQGHDVATAMNGMQALEHLRKDDAVRIVVCDWMMPEMDGLQLCREIRRGSTGGYVYVILVTGQDNPGCVIRGLSAGADDFLVKPFEFGELAARIATGERILSLETRHLAIFALAKLAESRDPETGQHLERIREYTKALAIALTDRGEFKDTLTPAYVSTLYHTSPLHDIGKVGIPDSILLKPGRLSDEEFQVMKHHTTIGGETLGSVSRQYQQVDYLRVGTEIAMSHHERFNGKGYPMHLKGESIPLSARIVALADVYDAVTSKRVYKAACTHDIARDIVIRERGEHFDPRVVDAFEACEGEFIRIGEEFADASHTKSASYSTASAKHENTLEEVKVA